jgi:hypothetical protein
MAAIYAEAEREERGLSVGRRGADLDLDSKFFFGAIGGYQRLRDQKFGFWEGVGKNVTLSRDALPASMPADR